MDEDQLPAAVASLIEIGGLLSQMVAHMSEAPPRSDPGGQLVAPIPDVLQTLLTDTLRPLTERFPPMILEDVAEFLAAADAKLAADILLVPHARSPARNRAARRRRR